MSSLRRIEGTAVMVLLVSFVFRMIAGQGCDTEGRMGEERERSIIIVNVSGGGDYMRIQWAIGCNGYGGRK